MQIKNREALIARRTRVKELLDQPRPSASPSSEEWVSSEFWSGRRQILTEELNEINALLKRRKA